MVDIIKHFKRFLPDTWKYYNESCLNWDGKTTALIVKQQTGTKYKDGEIQPFTVQVQTRNVPETLSILETFIKTQHEEYFIDQFQYYKQYYYSPVVPTTNNAVGNNYIDLILFNGVLSSAKNVCDIKEIFINGVEIFPYDIQITYQTNGEANRTAYNNLAETNIRSAITGITIEMIETNDPLNITTRALFNNGESPNKEFTIHIEYTDNNTLSMISKTAIPVILASKAYAEGNDYPIYDLGDFAYAVNDREYILYKDIEAAAYYGIPSLTNLGVCNKALLKGDHIKIEDGSTTYTAFNYISSYSENGYTEDHIMVCSAVTKHYTKNNLPVKSYNFSLKKV